MEDEWVVVWLLRELTRKFHDLWVKVADNDGEFLLIEAAGTLPGWLEPEVAENRVGVRFRCEIEAWLMHTTQVWIHGGGLTIIKPKDGNKASSKRTGEKLKLEDAQRLLVSEPQRLMRSTSIEVEAFYRLRNYPQQIRDNMHHALVTIPRKVAYLMHKKPAYISPGTEAFYLRDPIALKPLQSKDNNLLVFKPEDLVTVSIRFPRVGYAQLKSQDFPTPAVWSAKLPAKSASKAYGCSEIGMKITCGFEMLLSDPQNQDKPAVREMKMLLEDLEAGDDSLPTDTDVAGWDKLEDDETWLDISFEDLEGELAGKDRKTGAKRGNFGDTAAQENLQRIVAQFEEFLNDDTAGADGAGLFDEGSDDDLDDDGESDEGLSDAGEDKEASFDEEQFSAMMREMMGIPNDSAFDQPLSKRQPGLVSSAGRVEELEPDEEDDAEAIQSLTQRMEAELKESGALDLVPASRKVGAARRAVKGEGTATNAKEDETESDSEHGEGDNIDANLARNLLESFKSQAGMAGPGGNVMRMMGLSMPRDEDDGAGKKH